jgi:four helix bundle protein
MSEYRRLEDLIVYQNLCRLHIEIDELSRRWPVGEKYELGSQIRRSSNSSAAQIAEKYDDRHVRNKIEGVNRSRGEAAETVHHLFMARLKGYETQTTYETYRARYQECIRMLNGIERALEKQLPESDRRWPGVVVREDAEDYGSCPAGFPVPSDLSETLSYLSGSPEPRTLNPSCSSSSP